MVERGSERLTILREMAEARGDGFVSAQWVAESCDHFYDTPWASTRLRALVVAGYVEKRGRMEYRITDAGRTLLAEAGTPT